ncbi:uncharacterized protein LOC136040365 [Artemia franciscana]|uniref:uncharacterized protein LOC136040365 n=1 Tax=Artemia franciscana TaxID=6661 RepID=UPI0032DBE383
MLFRFFVLFCVAVAWAFPTPDAPSKDKAAAKIEKVDESDIDGSFFDAPDFLDDEEIFDDFDLTEPEAPSTPNSKEDDRSGWYRRFYYFNQPHYGGYYRPSYGFRPYAYRPYPYRPYAYRRYGHWW